MTMKIKVEQRHIDKGEREEPCYCPIALAAREAFGTDGVMVFLRGIWIDWDEDACAASGHYPLPSEAIQFYRDFDDLQNVTPFEFEVN